MRGRRNQVPAETRLDYDTFQRIGRRLSPELAVEDNQDEEDEDPDDGRRREPLLVHPVKQSDQYDRYVAEQPGDLLPYHLLQRPGSPVDIGIRLSKLRRGKQVSTLHDNAAMLATHGISRMFKLRTLSMQVAQNIRAYVFRL